MWRNYNINKYALLKRSYGQRTKKLDVTIHTTVLNAKLLTKVHECIVVIRGVPVISDADVAHLYGVETRRVNEQYAIILISFLMTICFFCHPRS